MKRKKVYTGARRGRKPVIMVGREFDNGNLVVVSDIVRDPTGPRQKPKSTNRQVQVRCKECETVFTAYVSNLMAGKVKCDHEADEDAPTIQEYWNETLTDCGFSDLRALDPRQMYATDKWPKKDAETELSNQNAAWYAERMVIDDANDVRAIFAAESNRMPCNGGHQTNASAEYEDDRAKWFLNTFFNGSKAALAA